MGQGPTGRAQRRRLDRAELEAGAQEVEEGQGDRMGCLRGCGGEGGCRSVSRVGVREEEWRGEKACSGRCVERRQVTLAVAFILPRGRDYRAKFSAEL